MWLNPPWFGCWFSFALACSGVGHGCSPLFVLVINLVFVFSLWCVGWVGAFVWFVFLCISVLGVGARGGIGWLSECFGPHGGFDPRSKAVNPVLVLLFVALWFILRGNLLYVFPCVILFLCFSVLFVLRYLAWGRES